MSSIGAPLQPASLKLLAAWLQLPRPRMVPTRAAFDPCEVASILPIISLIERTPSNQWRVRLAGTELERRWGRDLAGLSYPEILSAQAAGVTDCEFEAVCAQPCGSRSRRRLDLRSGRRLQIETLHLPLRGRDGQVSLIVSCNGELSRHLVYEGDQPREIVAVFEQEFFDIGAGIPPYKCVPEC